MNNRLFVVLAKTKHVLFIKIYRKSNNTHTHQAVVISSFSSSSLSYATRDLLVVAAVADVLFTFRTIPKADESCFFWLVNVVGVQLISDGVVDVPFNTCC